MVAAACKRCGITSRRARACFNCVESCSSVIFLFEHDLFGKPASTFPDRAQLAAVCTRCNWPATARILRGDAIQIAKADKALIPIAIAKASA